MQRSKILSSSSSSSLVGRKTSLSCVGLVSCSSSSRISAISNRVEKRKKTRKIFFVTPHFGVRLVRVCVICVYVFPNFCFRCVVSWDILLIFLLSEDCVFCALLDVSSVGLLNIYALQEQHCEWWRTCAPLRTCWRRRKERKANRGVEGGKRGRPGSTTTVGGGSRAHHRDCKEKNLL